MLKLKKITYIYATILFATILFACSESEVFTQTNYSTISPESNSNLDMIRHHIKISESLTRSSDVQINPYIYEGDTVMYIVNYDKGWELYSNDTSVPMVLASSETGSLDLSSEDLPEAQKKYILFMAERLHSRITEKIRNVEAVGEWSTYTYADSLNTKMPDSIIYIEEGISATSSVPNIINPIFQYENPDGRISTVVPPGTILGAGRWVFVRSLPIVTEIPIDVHHLISTHWSQRYPWNEFTPYDDGVHSLVGCVAVAIGQYLYYANRHFNRPSSMPSHCNYNPSTNKYNYYDYSSTVWNSMALSGTSKTANTDSVAVMLGYIGKKVDMEYCNADNGGSGAFVDNYTAYLNELGFACQRSNLSEDDYTIMSIAAGKPVLLRLRSLFPNGSIEGHVVVIDAAKVTVTTQRDVYGWLGTDSSGNSTVIYDSNMQPVYYKYVSFNDDVTTVEQIAMNWGWGEDEIDNVWFSILEEADYEAYNVHYNYLREIIKTNL